MDPEKRCLLLSREGEVEGSLLAHPSGERRRWRRLLLPMVAFLAIGAAAFTHSACWAPSAATRMSTHIHKQAGGAGSLPEPHAVQSRSPVTDTGVDGDVVPYAATTTSTAPAPSRTVLKCFEVDQPVLLPDGPEESDGSSKVVPTYAAESCTVLLMRRDFAWSYEDPFVGTYFTSDMKSAKLRCRTDGAEHD